MIYPVMHPQEHPSTGTLVHCSCLTIRDFAVQAEMVAVETSIDVGKILWIFNDCLCTLYLCVTWSYVMKHSDSNPYSCVELNS